MKKKIAALILTLGLALGSASRGFSADAPSQSDGGAGIMSAVLSLFYFPIKLATCVTGQTLGGAAYVLTYSVPGSFEGGTHGSDAGEVATRSCAGPWIIQPADVKRDYQLD